MTLPLRSKDLFQIVSTECYALKHGTSLRAYEYHGCRCPEAIEAKKEQYRKRNQKLKSGKFTGLPRLEKEIDWINVELLVAGHYLEPNTTTTAERFEAIRCLTKQGYSLAQIALRLRINQRTVLRYRSGAYHVSLRSKSQEKEHETSDPGQSKQS